MICSSEASHFVILVTLCNETDIFLITLVVLCNEKSCRISLVLRAIRQSVPSLLQSATGVTAYFVTKCDDLL